MTWLRKQTLLSLSKLINIRLNNNGFKIRQTRFDLRITDCYLPEPRLGRWRWQRLPFEGCSEPRPLEINTDNETRTASYNHYCPFRLQHFQLLLKIYTKAAKMILLVSLMIGPLLAQGCSSRKDVEGCDKVRYVGVRTVSSIYFF